MSRTCYFHIEQFPAVVLSASTTGTQYFPSRPHICIQVSTENHRKLHQTCIYLEIARCNYRIKDVASMLPGAFESRASHCRRKNRAKSSSPGGPQSVSVRNVTTEACSF